MALFDLIGVSAAFGAVFPADHASFEQDVVPLLGGGVMRASSSLQVTNYSIAVGPRTPVLVLAALPDSRAWVVALFADYGRSVIHGDRYISDCDDCRTENSRCRAEASGASAPTSASSAWCRSIPVC